MSTIPYVRIGTIYYKIVQFPSITGQFKETLMRWDVNTIIRDHGKKYLSEIECFDGSVCYPNHLEYKRKIAGFYNTYAPLKYKPKQGELIHTLLFFKHIFQDQFDLGLDYFKILYEVPIQPLPIICLVSNERSTGKTSFLKYLKEVFGYNMTYLDTHSLNSNFNYDWGDKLLLGLDEAFLQKEEITEKIKYLSTSNKNKIEVKGKERLEIDFFGKFIMCSNKEDSFIKIDPLENRFWVLKIPKILNEDVDFLNKLINEIPAFLSFIINRNFTTQRKTRMWFTYSQIETPALKKLVRSNKNPVEKEVAAILLSVMERYELESIDFVPMDLLHALNRNRIKIDLNQIRQLLKKDWKLKNQNNTLSYRKFTISLEGEFIMSENKGRYFTITKNFLNENFDELMNE